MSERSWTCCSFPADGPHDDWCPGFRLAAQALELEALREEVQPYREPCYVHLGCAHDVARAKAEAELAALQATDEMRSTGEMSKRLDEAEASLAQARKDLEAVSANRDHWKASAKECPHCLGQGTILGNECGCGGKR